MKELKDKKQLHPTNVRELAEVNAYYPFEWNGKRLRCVPMKDRCNNPCRKCYFEKERNTHLRCPMNKACMAAYRYDNRSVKFISDELSSLNMDEVSMAHALQADKICYK